MLYSFLPTSMLGAFIDPPVYFRRCLWRTEPPIWSKKGQVRHRNKSPRQDREMPERLAEARI